MPELPDNFITRLMRGEVAQHAVGRTLGARIVALDLEAGRLEMGFDGVDAFLNPAGTVQGGMLAAMLDDVTASLVTATAGPDERCATLDLHVSFVKPCRVGPIEASATLVRRGREVCIVQGALRRDGETVAIATATCRIGGPR